MLDSAVPAGMPGPELRRLMAERGMRCGQLAARAGVSATLVSDVTHGRRSLTARTCVSLGAALGADPGYLATLQARAYLQTLLAEIGRLSAAEVAHAPQT